MHKCSRCGEEDPCKFYGHKKTICGKCHNEYTMNLGRQKRQYAVDKLGGKCINCGFDKWIVSLDIHHLDPKIKDSKFAQMRGWSLQRIDNEIKNCVLLCRNCHAAVHAGLLELP
ncbi:hypothetical protein YP6_00168 [Escherichia phage YP-6]|uniref:HNH domain-containing protein n=2 Tax=Vequintavirus TaxID=1914852 RepID=A0AAE9ZPT5_9CAUD|nr:hypothetical protein navn_40 [Escherichia phage navn]WDS61974.1 hypothetical protein YP6_00168 [Escherichia phage YP-6]WLY85570.1 HNH endonuclease [Escherichia phage 241Ecol014PP]